MNTLQSLSPDSWPNKLFYQTAYTINHPDQWYMPNNHGINFLNQAMERLGEAIMPAKKRQDKKPQYNQVEFVNVSLTKKDKETFKTWYDARIAELPDMVAKFISEGYKISFRWDSDNECYICSATCIDESMENHNKCLTSRSDQWLEALALNLFKTDTLCKDGIWESTETGYNWG